VRSCSPMPPLLADAVIALNTSLAEAREPAHVPNRGRFL
jgi:hypothetical protein